MIHFDEEQKGDFSIKKVKYTFKTWHPVEDSKGYQEIMNLSDQIRPDINLVCVLNYTNIISGQVLSFNLGCGKFRVTFGGFMFRKGASIKNNCNYNKKNIC